MAAMEELDAKLALGGAPRLRSSSDARACPKVVARRV
jgi:hypothetical protein